ncbi:hypothetical protein MVEN_01129300 [Mycena venus]|uniref:Uncharacterized protein n=1 Tax=Mycena venus TaxID=2733690 RepID=A0A8H7D0P6_9AGAR|nr:hypothetical protein MVEN_01129300 [Mycena venus]
MCIELDSDNERIVVETNMVWELKGVWIRQAAHVSKYLAMAPIIPLSNNVRRCRSIYNAPFYHGQSSMIDFSLYLSTTSLERFVARTKGTAGFFCQYSEVGMFLGSSFYFLLLMSTAPR